MLIVKSNDVEFEYKLYDDNGQHTLFKALKGVNIDIEEGSFVTILGQNGSGKSTFSKLVNGLLMPSSGRMNVHGQDTLTQDIWEIRKKTGMVFQNPDNQIVCTIVEDDVAFGAENIGIPRNELIERVEEALKTVDMLEYKDKSPSQLSGGQKQRVAIAGILAMKPNLIILDEPTAMLDPIGRKQVIDQVIKLNKEENITILLITHYMEEAVMSDKIIVMDEGEVKMTGTPREIFTKVEEIERLGLDVPPMTRIAYNLKNNGIDIKDDVLTIEEMVGELCKFL